MAHVKWNAILQHIKCYKLFKRAADDVIVRHISPDIIRNIRSYPLGVNFQIRILNNFYLGFCQSGLNLSCIIPF